MNNRIQQLFALNQKLLDLANSITNDLTWINKPKGHYIAMSFGKGYKIFSAIILLCQNGYGQDALVLARTLFELTVNTYYIFKDTTDGRVDRYFGYQSVLRSKAIKHFLINEESKAILVAKFNERNNGETIESVLKQAEDAQKKYNFKNNRWSEDNLADMADEAGLEHLYKTLYKVQNDLTHSTVGGIGDYLLFEDGHLTVKIGSDYKRIETCLVHNIDMFCRLMGQFSLYFSLEKDKELQEFAKELESILNNTILLNRYILVLKKEQNSYEYKSQHNKSSLLWRFQYLGTRSNAERETPSSNSVRDRRSMGVPSHISLKKN